MRPPLADSHECSKESWIDRREGAQKEECLDREDKSVCCSMTDLREETMSSVVGPRCLLFGADDMSDAIIRCGVLSARDIPLITLMRTEEAAMPMLCTVVPSSRDLENGPMPLIGDATNAACDRRPQTSPGGQYAPAGTAMATTNASVKVAHLTHLEFTTSIIILQCYSPLLQNVQSEPILVPIAINTAQVS